MRTAIKTTIWTILMIVIPIMATWLIMRGGTPWPILAIMTVVMIFDFVAIYTAVFFVLDEE